SRLRTSASSSSVYPVSGGGLEGFAGSSARSVGRSCMAAAPLVGCLAGRQRTSQGALVPPEVAADEHRLVLRHFRELHPRELVAPAGDVEETLPVAASEAHDAFRPDDVPRQAAEEAFEGLLLQRARGSVNEAREAVGMQVVGCRLPGALAKGGHPGREE